jgi:biotin transport system substrate-specific component
MTSTYAPLALAAPRTSPTAYRIALVVAGSLLLTLSAKIQIPFWPVPMTMQPYVVLVLGMALGPRLGAAAVALYLLQGALGLPVFAGTPEKGIGLAYMAGPTGGYLAGFVVAAAATGLMAGRGLDRHPLGALLTATVGMVLIYACGLAWLSSLVGWDKAVTFGALPFMLGDALKILLAMVTLPLAWRALGRRTGAPAS